MAGLWQQKARRVRSVARGLRCEYACRVGRTPVVKVYGLLRTGTNYLTRLIELNFDAFCMRSREHGWKHGPCDYDDRLRYVFMVKDPYSWLVSFMDWERIHERFEGDISSFLDTPLTHPELREAWGEDDVVAVWGRTLRAWSELSASPRVAFVRYEDVLASFPDALATIGERLQLDCRPGGFRNLEKRADDWKTPNPRVRRAENYYRDKLYLDDLGEAQLAKINARLDLELVERFGYQRAGVFGMKICMFGASFLPRRGGMEYVIHNLSQALVTLGHEVTVIAERTAWAGIGVEHDYALARYGLPMRGLRSSGFSEIESLYRIGRQHRRTGFDVLHCHSVSYAGTRAVRAKRRFGIPVVMTPHGEDVQRVPQIGYGLRLDPAWDERIRDNLSAADAVTAISKSVENELDCVPSQRVVRIPNGVHIGDFGREPSRFLRDRLGLADDETIVLSVGRNHIKKGYDLGIRAIAELRDRERINKVHYAIVGKLATQHASLVEELGLASNVSLIEELAPDEVRQCYRSADIFFSPSIIEGLSLVSIEAIASGLPVVVTDVPGNVDIVDDTGAGEIVASEDPVSMAQGLARLITDAGRRATLAERALQQSVRYDWKAVAGQYLALYRAVCEGKAPASFMQGQQR